MSMMALPSPATGVHAPATVARHPFVAPHQGEVPEGETLAQFVARAVAAGHLTLAEARSAALEITVHGAPIPRALWHLVRPKAGALVLVRLRQSGGGSGKKNPLRTILQLLVVIAVSAISGGALGTIAGISFAPGTTAAIVAAGVASIALNALVNAIAPIPQPQLGERSQSYTLSGSRNAADPYGPCVMTLGRMRVTPKLACRPFTRAYNDDTVLYMLFQWHVGKCEISELKIGDTPIGDFQDVTVEHRLLGEPYADEITLIPNLVIENPDISIELKNADGWHVRSFPKNSTGLSLDLVLPGGLNQQKDGKSQNRTIVVDAEYRLIGAGSWTKVPTGASPHMSAAGRFTLTANKTSAIRRSLVWDGASGAGDYEVRVMRVSDDNRPITVSDDIYWMGVRGDRPGAPVLDDSLCLTAVRIVASGQLNGVIDQLNAIVEPIMPVWSGGTWTTEAKTRNPAALFRWLHTGQAISPADRLDTAELNGPALAAWYEYCVTKGLTCDHVFDYAASVDEAAQLVAACGYATAAWALGKRTAVIDDEKLPTQIFTSETVRGFRGRIAYLDEVHALRCLFANAAAGYKPDEVIVYADGYDASTATKFQQAEIPGKTLASDVWKAGRRLLKRAEHRRVSYEFEIDTECLVSSYGERVLVEHFALHREAMSARVEAVVETAGEVTGVTLSETVTMEHGASYGLQVRRGADGTLPVFDVVNPATPGVPWSGATLTFTGPALEAFEPAVGDLVVWGRTAAMLEDVSLTRLAPAKDEFTASVSAVPYTAALFSDDGATAPAHLSAINGQAAGGLVLNPVRPFTALEARLTAMLGDISAAAGDGVLTPAEKVGLVPQLKQLITTEAALVARAGALGITTEKTAFEAAMATLTAYLATLTTDVAWDDQSGNTDVTGATLIADYRAALEAQIALQDAIDAANANVLVGLGANGAVNSEFRNGLVGWEWGWDGDGGATPVRSLVTGGINYVQAVVTGTPANNTVFDIIETDRSTASYWNGAADPATIRASFLQCKAGDRIFAVAPVAYENAQHVILALLFYDQAGTYLSETGLGSGGTNGFPTAGNPALFTTVGGFATAPANAAYVGLYTRVVCSGAANPKGYVGGRIQLCVVPAGQTAWPPYSPGPSDKAATKGAVIGTNILRPDATLPGLVELETPKPNRLKNSSGRLGSAHWTTPVPSTVGPFGSEYIPNGGFSTGAVSAYTNFQSQSVPVLAGQSYSASGKVWLGARTAGAAHIYMAWVDSGGTEIGYPAETGSLTTNGNPHVWSAPNLVAPAGAVSLRMVLYCDALSASYCVFSELKIEDGIYATAWTEDADVVAASTDQIIDQSSVIGRAGLVTSLGTAAAITGQKSGATTQITAGTSAPGSPASGDWWLDTNTTVPIWKRWSGSAWVATNPEAPYLTAGGQIVDYRGLPINSLGPYGITRSDQNVIGSTIPTTQITIISHTVYAPGGNISVTGGTITGLTASTIYDCFWRMSNSTLSAEVAGSTAANEKRANPDYLWLATGEPGATPNEEAGIDRLSYGNYL